MTRKKTVPYSLSPSSSLISITAASPHEDPVSQEVAVADAISNIMADLLAIAQIQDTPTSTKYVYTLEATHIELAFYLEDVALAQGPS